MQQFKWGDNCWTDAQFGKEDRTRLWTAKFMKRVQFFENNKFRDDKQAGRLVIQ